MRVLAALIAALALLAGAAFAQERAIPSRVNSEGLRIFPDAPAYCAQTRARLYANCGSQAAILNAARAAADAADKRVLVIVGADWCAWCLVLDQALDGVVEPINEDTHGGLSEADAARLSRYVAERLVLTHINVDRVDATSALQRIGINAVRIDAVPEVYLLAEDGRRAQRINAVSAELPDLRGYDRGALLALLQDQVD